MSRVRILHLSDPHFGTVLPDVRSALLEAARRLVPDLCLLSGDITQRARRRQFLDAREFVRELTPVQTFAVPGNHDVPLFNVLGRLFYPYAGFHGYFQDKRETRIAFGGVEVFGLNSTSRWRHVQGNLDVERVRGAFSRSESGSAVRIVAIHHPLACAKESDDKNRLTNRAEVFRFFEEANVDLVLSGHVHDPFVTLSDARFAARRPMILSVAGTCLSWRTRDEAPNSFHLIDVEAVADAQLTLTRYDLHPSGEFLPKPGAAHRFVRTRGRWDKI